MEFNELIRERFSCRSLSDRDIPHEALDRIFEAARLAPTAVNKQPFKIWAVESPEARTKLRRRRAIPSARVSFLSSAERTRTHGYGSTTDATLPMWMPPSSRPTSCSPFTTRAFAQHGSDISTRPNSKRHSLRWQTTTSSPSSPSATRPKRASPPRAIRSAKLQWKSWRYCK